MFEHRAQLCVLGHVFVVFQVVTLKKILGIVDKKDSLDFESVKHTLCRQQDKIEHLKR